MSTNIKDSIVAFKDAIPASVKRVIRDCLEGAIAAIGAVAITMPTTLGEARDQGLVVAVAAISAAIAVFRREGLPLIVSWVLGQFGGPSTPPAA